LLTTLELLLGGVDALLLLPVSVLFAEVVLAVTKLSSKATKQGERRRLAVIVPAHNESSNIADTLRSIRPQLSDSDRLIVVADNCTDNTAGIATAEGAQAIERRDLTQRGKGFALDFGVRHLEQDPPDVVIIVDADCLVAPGSIDRLARVCDSYSRPVQALYLMRAPAGADPRMQIAEFSWTVKNLVRPSGLHRLGLPCNLTGSGMAFPWSRIRSAKLATGHIVEDLKLGIDLARAGVPPLYCPDAIVTSEFPYSAEGISRQRTRWEHGHLSIIFGHAPRLFLDSLVSMNAGLLALALDVTVPPLALLTLLVIACWVISCGFYLLTKVRLPVEIASISAGLLMLSILFAWVRYGRHIIAFRNLPLVIVYASRKIPLYAKFLVVRQKTWIRTKRREED
jgi:cellulose synthase/poly-beta-1,6-N-acetylglucosamine synthase-like glycosyltransferase